MPLGVIKKFMVVGAVALMESASIPHRSMAIIPVLPVNVMLVLGGGVLILILHSLGVFAILQVS